MECVTADDRPRRAFFPSHARAEKTCTVVIPSRPQGRHVRRVWYAVRRSFRRRPACGRRSGRRRAPIGDLARQAAGIFLGAVADRSLRTFWSLTERRWTTPSTAIRRSTVACGPLLLDAYRTLDAYPDVKAALVNPAADRPSHGHPLQRRSRHARAAVDSAGLAANSTSCCPSMPRRCSRRAPTAYHLALDALSLNADEMSSSPRIAGTSPEPPPSGSSRSG